MTSEARKSDQSIGKEERTSPCSSEATPCESLRLSEECKEDNSLETQTSVSLQRQGPSILPRQVL